LKQTDQLIFNRVLAKEVTTLPPADNYLLAHRQRIQKSTGQSVHLARALHYNNQFKPWETGKMWRQASRDGAMVPAWKLWSDAYFELITSFLARGITIKQPHLKNIPKR